MMRNLSIKTKLLTGFISIVLLIGVTGFFGKFGLSNTENSVEQLYSDNFKSIDEIHSIKENFLSEIKIVNDTVLGQDSSKTETSFQKIDTIRTKNSAIIEAFSSSNMSDDEKKAYDDFNSLLKDKYSSEKDNLFELIKEGNYVEAKRKLSEINQTTDNMSKDLDDLIEINQKQAEEAYNSAVGNYKITINIMHTILILGIILSIIIGTALSTYIIRTIKKDYYLLKL
ncbi:MULTISPECIES: MCP four helix bundle domain-containing protein [unclassified Clostridium]|uniref:MCP four helix bundle domain-containing protein n=1 Tax=unclassified Clostridium TaxID=2614128 RepID=UPI0002973571|nr:MULTISPECIES: MCP four helix bundle domain-containing protein [unclassified Clostridium]EKQ57643.1 MAG: hypothetical protein A370_00775 [Clostridium sp. Maddingley MBC34-26]